MTMEFLGPRREVPEVSPAADIEWGYEEESPQELLDQALVRIDQLEKSAKTGEHEHGQLRRRLDRLERQLGALMAARTAERDDLPGAEHGKHQALARRYRTLVEQRLLNFARRYAERCDRVMDHSPRERSYRLMGLLSQQLFIDDLKSSREIVRRLHLPEGDGHIESALTTLRGHCSELATEIHRAGLRHSWDMECKPGVALDPARQEQWPSCDQGAPVLFVVAPAYVVNGRSYCLQYVYTSA
ncbi:hypothetical protein OG298_22580 [Streptomyces sp. NBC_01005]|uniref:hypothetical protein n=1 Tax=unclassified Streptomyces TaxID=2593676 RepID=UPI00386B7532|nr:hypothetical protein OG298_22580 [Streptomyces sp. NBC_01005]WTC96441.1 hypothetical protein OH736_22595 [Streptomyces sp. NBC_01650]